MKLIQVDDVQYLTHDGPDMINVSLRKGKQWETGTLTIAKMLLDKIENPAIVDVGANLGAFVVPMGHWLRKRGGLAHAFEPQRLVYYQLCANLFVNRLSHCLAHHAAIGAAPTTIQVPQLSMARDQNFGALSLDPDIRRQQGLHTKPMPMEPVALYTLDQLQLPRAHLVKIDVEGMELEVIQGGLQWLTGCGFPHLLFEVWGDYMRELIPKRNKLLSLVKDELGYDVSMVGELCVAQHPTRAAINIKLMEGGRFSVERIARKTSALRKGP